MRLTAKARITAATESGKGKSGLQDTPPQGPKLTFAAGGGRFVATVWTRDARPAPPCPAEKRAAPPREKQALPQGWNRILVPYISLQGQLLSLLSLPEVKNPCNPCHSLWQRSKILVRMLFWDIRISSFGQF